MVVYMMFVGYIPKFRSWQFLTINVIPHYGYWLLLANKIIAILKILWYPLLTWFEMGCRRLGDYAWCLVQAGKGNLFFIFCPQTVCAHWGVLTVRVKAGAWSGFQLVHSILPVNFRIKWLLWNVQVRFDCQAHTKCGPGLVISPPPQPHLPQLLNIIFPHTLASQQIQQWRDQK